ncbi:hypothetical protein HDV57DRAFT_340193 [Trichoderma longibrachiatum]
MACLVTFSLVSLVCFLFWREIPAGRQGRARGRQLTGQQRKPENPRTGQKRSGRRSRCAQRSCRCKQKMLEQQAAYLGRRQSERLQVKEEKSIEVPGFEQFRAQQKRRAPTAAKGGQ